MGMLVLTRHPEQKLVLTQPGNRTSTIMVESVGKSGITVHLTTPDSSETVFVAHGTAVKFAGGQFEMQPGWGIAKGQARILLTYPSEVNILREELVQ